MKNITTSATAAFMAWGLLSIGGENLLPNPSFEKGDKKPLSWVVWGGQKSEASWSGKYTKSGNKSLSISNTAGKSGCRWITEEAIKVTPGAEYELTGWIKTVNAKGNCTISISWYSKKGWFASKRSLLINRTHAWRLLTLRVKAPAKAVCAKIYVGKIRSGSGDCWFDDLSFKQIGNTDSEKTKLGKISWSRKIEKKAAIIIPDRQKKGRAVTGWNKLNPQDCLGLSSSSGVLSIKDTFGNFTGWISKEDKITPGKLYKLQASIFRNKSYNVFMGIVWRNANHKLLAVSLSQVEPSLQKWQFVAISAQAPDASRFAQYIFLQRRSSGETRIQTPLIF
jgi:Carbohydrate binding domain